MGVTPAHRFAAAAIGQSAGYGTIGRGVRAAHHTEGYPISYTAAEVEVATEILLACTPGSRQACDVADLTALVEACAALLELRNPS